MGINARERRDRLLNAGTRWDPKVGIKVRWGILKDVTFLYQVRLRLLL